MRRSINHSARNKRPGTPNTNCKRNECQMNASAQIVSSGMAIIRATQEGMRRCSPLLKERSVPHSSSAENLLAGYKHE
jgi:hypothetical protein